MSTKANEQKFKNCCTLKRSLPFAVVKKQNQNTKRALERAVTASTSEGNHPNTSVFHMGSVQQLTTDSYIRVSGQFDEPRARVI